MRWLWWIEITSSLFTKVSFELRKKDFLNIWTTSFLFEFIVSVVDVRKIQSLILNCRFALVVGTDWMNPTFNSIESLVNLEMWLVNLLSMNRSFSHHFRWVSVENHSIRRFLKCADLFADRFGIPKRLFREYLRIMICHLFCMTHFPLTEVGGVSIVVCGNIWRQAVVTLWPAGGRTHRWTTTPERIDRNFLLLIPVIPIQTVYSEVRKNSFLFLYSNGGSCSGLCRYNYEPDRWK